MENMELKDLKINIAEVRLHAKNSIEKGPVTEDYKLDLAHACQLLNLSLASEILCVLRYRQHQISVKGIDFPYIAAEFKEHAECEEKHVILLAERINQLGGNPDFNPTNLIEKSATEFGSGNDLISMIKEDLIAERISVEVYRKSIHWFGESDPTTRRILESILEDEEEHANDMADLLAKIQLPHLRKGALE
jgi:bacterioferritin